MVHLGPEPNPEWVMTPMTLPPESALIISLPKQKLLRDIWTADIRLQLNLHSLSTLSNPDSQPPTLRHRLFMQLRFGFETIKAYLSLHHGGALRAQRTDRLEHVHDALVLHALEHRRESDEHARATHARAVTTNIIDYNNIY